MIIEILTILVAIVLIINFIYVIKDNKKAKENYKKGIKILINISNVILYIATIILIMLIVKLIIT